MTGYGEAGSTWGSWASGTWGDQPTPEVVTRYGDATYGANYYGQGALSTSPVFMFEIWTPSGEWVDATCDVRSVRVDRGRTSYVDAQGAATATVELANATGVYSGWSVFGIWAKSSPYRVNVPIRLRTLYGSTLSGMFYGSTDAVTDSWPGTTDALASVTATDGFKFLARHSGVARAAVGAGELSGARINRLADDAAYAGTRMIDAGTVTLQATTMEGVTLDLMRQVGEAEWGWLYFNVDGALVFRQRDAVQTDPRMVNVQWTLTDDAMPGAVCYSDLSIPIDDSDVWNVAQVTPPGVATQTAQDANSVAWFGPRTWTRTDVPLVNTTDALNLAQLVVLEQANAARRVESVTFRASHSPAAWACATGVRMNDRVRLIRHYPDGYVLDAELLVQGVHHTITADGSGVPNAWDVTLDTADALQVRDYGQWDVAKWDTTDQWGV